MTAPTVAGAPAQPRPTTASPVLRYLRFIRYRELFLLQGTPLFAVAFTIPAITPGTLGTTLVFAVAGFLLLAHTFTFNDWAEFASDLMDPEKAATLVGRDASRPELAILSVGLLALALGLFGLLSGRALALAALLAVLGVLYSHPAIHVKGMPLASSAIHLVAGVLHFLLGYSLFGSVDARGVAIGLYFALTFTAGHLNQEVRDCEGDRLNGIRTNAVAFGPRRTFLVGLGLFTVAYAYLVALALAGLIPPVLAWLGLLYPVHALWSIRTLRAGLSFQSMTSFRDAYRALYAVIGLAMLAAVLLH